MHKIKISSKMGAILQFVLLQDVLMHNTSNDQTICDTIAFVHEAYGVEEVERCHYFTSRDSLETHIATNPMDAATNACRSSINVMWEVILNDDIEVVYACAKYKDDLCWDEWDETFFYCNSGIDCTTFLQVYANMSVAKWKAATNAWDVYSDLGGNDKALAIACYASNDILDDIVNAGKTLHDSFNRAKDYMLLDDLQ